MIKPILFNTDMVRAILNGQKTVTRRVVKPQPPDNDPHNVCFDYIENGTAKFGLRNRTPHFVKLPYQPGDILYVPQAWKCRFAMLDHDGLGYEVVFRDGKIVRFRFDEKERAKKWAKYARKNDNHWQSPYFMPREAAQIFLRVTEVRVERLQDIILEGCLKEGIPKEEIMERDALRPNASARWLFERLWNSTIKPADRDKYGWAANPWVWLIEFERISKEEAMKNGKS